MMGQRGETIGLRASGRSYVNAVGYKRECYNTLAMTAQNIAGPATASARANCRPFDTGKLKLGAGAGVRIDFGSVAAARAGRPAMFFSCHNSADYASFVVDHYGMEQVNKIDDAVFTTNTQEIRNRTSKFATRLYQARLRKAKNNQRQRRTLTKNHRKAQQEIGKLGWVGGATPFRGGAPGAPLGTPAAAVPGYGENAITRVRGRTRGGRRR